MLKHGPKRQKFIANKSWREFSSWHRDLWKQMRRQGAEASMLQRLWEQDPMSFSPPNLKILLSSCVLQISAVEGGCYKVQGLPVNGASWTFCCSGAAVAVRFHGRYGEVRQKCITVDDTPADQLLNPEQWAHRALSILIDSAVPEEWK